MTNRILACLHGLLLCSVTSCRPQAAEGEFFRIIPEKREYSITIDLSDPTNYTGIPNAKWFPMGDREFCAIQGIVATTIKLPDGKSISETFHLVYIDRDSEGIFRVRANSRGWLHTEKATKRIQRELSDWALGTLAPADYSAREAAIQTWLQSRSNTYEPEEGFRIQRAGYEFGFALFALGGPQSGEFSYYYMLSLREPEVRKPRPNHALQRTGAAVTPAATTPPPSPIPPGSGRASGAGR